MLQALVTLALRFRGLVIALACLLVVYGAYTALHSKLDVFPDFVPPQVTVQTEAPGLAPEQVEALVTLPVESAISGLGGLESVRSESIQGLSVVTVVFHDTADVFRERQLLAEKIGELAGRLPAGVKTPRLSPLTSSTMDLLKIGLTSESLTPMELRTFADFVLKPRLLAIPGVTRCIVFGGEVRQLQIQVHPDRLLAYGLSMTDVLAAARASSGVVGAGFVENQNQRILIQTEGQALTPGALGSTVLVTGTNGVNVRLADVARVVAGPEPKFGDCVIQGQPGVLLAMASEYGANTLDATRALEAALKDLKPALDREGITLWPALHRPATFIETSLAHIRASLLLGALLVSIVLFLFLGNRRIAFISLTAIPLSLLTAVIVLDKLGVTLNTITLGGLAIAIGEVVDDAIIDVENIFRRLRENRASARPRSIFDVILAASLEVRTAVVYATLVVVLVFLPVLTLTGLQGAFFAPLALSYIIAILASLAVALTVTPALAYLLFTRGVPDPREPRVQHLLKAWYERVVKRFAAHPGFVLGTSTLVCLGALLVLPGFSQEFLPEFREGHFVMQVSLAPGTSLAETLRVGQRISRTLLENTNIATIEQQAGRAERGEDTWPPNRSEFHVELKPMSGRQQARMEETLRRTLAGIPGIQFEVMTFLGDRIGESISGETQPVVINLFGDDLDQLDVKAREIQAVLQRLPGVRDAQIKSLAGAPSLAVKLRPERLVQFGFRSTEVLEAVQAAYQGVVVAQTFEGNRVQDIVVILDEASRREPESVTAMTLRNSQGVRVPLNEVAAIYPTTGRHLISHDGARRRQTVSCGVEGVDAKSVVQAAKAQIARQINLPRGMYLEYRGAAEAQERAQRELLWHAGIAGGGILLLLSMVFRTGRHLLLVLANLPFAMVGGVGALVLAGLTGPGLGSLNLGSLVGFVTLFGITMRNSIMLISHFEHLVQAEGMTWGLDAALRGASERLVPILMTALVTGLGLLPLAMGAGDAGREIEGPMAVVILGGLVTSTLLNLLVLPTLALRFGIFEKSAVSS